LNKGDMMKLLIFILTILMSCTACNSNSQNHDSPDLHDSDKDTETIDETTDKTSEVPDETPDEFHDEVSEDEKNDSDSDKIPEEDIDEWADYDYPAGKEGDPDCPSLYNAGFPYIDGNGRKHFCRKCDLPAPANDPQCIRNLWEMKNREIMKEWPDYYCYPLPCDVTDKTNATDASLNHGECTVYATSDIYRNSTGVFRQSDIWEGKIGMFARASKKVDDKYIISGSLLYEIEEKKYTFVSNASVKMAYKYDRFLFLTGNSVDFKSYIVSAKKVDDGWKYEFIYTDEWDRIFFVDPPAIGRNFVLMNVENVDGKGEQEILYANVNDWEIKKLGTGIILYPQIYDDIAYFTVNNKVYACDLSLSPGNIENDCRKITREGELTKSFAVNKQNPKKVIYTDRNSTHQLNIADLSGEEITYKMLHLEKTPDLINFIPSQWDGDILVLEEFYVFSEGNHDFRICYYSISKERKVCFPNYYPNNAVMGYIYAGVEGKYIFYQPTGTIILRDMECYCKERPDLCLYDEYMPEETPDNDEIPDV
jgi:hypothetical protein